MPHSIAQTSGAPQPAHAARRPSPGAPEPAPLDWSERVARLPAGSRCAGALALAAVALVARYALLPVIGAQAPYLTLFPAVALAGLLGGPGPALAAGLAGTFAVEATLVQPVGLFSHAAVATLRAALALGSAWMVGLVGWRVRNAHTSLRRANARLEQADGEKSALLEQLRTANAELREKEERFRVITDAMPQIVCVLRPDGTPEYVNAQWRAFSGATLAETARAGWLGLLHPDDVPAARACRRRALESGQPQEVELRYRAASGGYRWFLSRLAPIRGAGGRVVRFVGAAMDITPHKEAEQSLRDADRRKTEFLGMLSHELRNPLAPIRNSIYLLERSDSDSEQARRARAVLVRQSDHLTRLVDDLLDVTRIARGKIELRCSPVDLREVLRRAADDLRSVLDARQLALALALPGEEAWIRGDATRLGQVVGNLLQNAAKFTPPGGRVTLALARAGDGFEIRVRDTGIGVPPDLLDRMFEPFVQADRSLARTEGGLGLGLALVRGIAELHGGAVRAESAGVGAGTELVVILPSECPPSACSPAAPDVSGPRCGGVPSP